MSAQRRAHHRLVEGRCCTGDECATRAHHRLVEERCCTGDECATRAHHRLVEERCCTGDECATRAHHRLVEEHRRWVQTVPINRRRVDPLARRGTAPPTSHQQSRAFIALPPDYLYRRAIIALATDRVRGVLQHSIELVVTARLLVGIATAFVKFHI